MIEVQSLNSLIAIFVGSYHFSFSYYLTACFQFSEFKHTILLPKKKFFSIWGCKITFRFIYCFCQFLKIIKNMSRIKIKLTDINSNCKMWNSSTFLFILPHSFVQFSLNSDQNMYSILNHLLKITCKKREPQNLFITMDCEMC